MFVLHGIHICVKIEIATLIVAELDTGASFTLLNICTSVEVVSRLNSNSNLSESRFIPANFHDRLPRNSSPGTVFVADIGLVKIASAVPVEVDSKYLRLGTCGREEDVFRVLTQITYYLKKTD